MTRVLYTLAVLALVSDLQGVRPPAPRDLGELPEARGYDPPGLVARDVAAWVMWFLRR